MPMIKSAKLHRFELYNLKDDQAQTKDLADREPELLTQLVDEMRLIHQDVIEDGPIWELD